MSRQIWLHSPVHRLVVGTVGVPGERTFFVQARTGDLLTSVVIEKQQVALLCDRLEGFLGELAEELDLPLGSADPTDDDPLDVPLVEEFRVGALAFGWDTAAQLVLLEFHGITDDDLDPTELDDDAPGPGLLRVQATTGQVLAFIQRARQVVAAGRPTCMFCQQPMDPGGHICPRANGYRR